MIVHERYPEGHRYAGRPIEVELTDTEQLMSELYNIQLDIGHGCLEALQALTRPDIPSTLRQENPVLDSILTPDFIDYLVGPQ